MHEFLAWLTLLLFAQWFFGRVILPRYVTPTKVMQL